MHEFDKIIFWLGYVFHWIIFYTLQLQEEILFEVLGLAHRYGFVELEEAISFYLEGILDNNNVCLIFDLASMFSLQSLCENCLRYMDRNAQEIIKTDAFQGLSVVSRNVLCTAYVFSAIHKFSIRLDFYSLFYVSWIFLVLTLCQDS